ncbi:MAG: radical SAM protein [Bacteroidales bacterium]|nr:radical SAM protein [Bacteroidales bacterium]
MSSRLFDQIIFGPVRSRRFGVSLGVNLLPVDAKICSFDCVYCECGWTDSSSSQSLPTANEVQKALEVKLLNMQAAGELPDVITFSGNGEPTMHPEFDEIIENTIKLRNMYSLRAEVVVLSNSTQLHKEKVRNALLKIDKAVLKLDSTNETQFQRINKPAPGIHVEDVKKELLRFEGKASLQTMFLRGQTTEGQIDNTITREIDALIEFAKVMIPAEWMIYPIDRPTPFEKLEKIQKDEMDEIAEYIRSKTNIPLKISY